MDVSNERNAKAYLGCRRIKFLTSVPLQEGRYEYKYIVDGEWMCNKYELVTSPNKDGHVNNYIRVWFNIQLF